MRLYLLKCLPRIASGHRSHTKSAQVLTARCSTARTCDLKVNVITATTRSVPFDGQSAYTLHEASHTQRCEKA